MPERASIPTPVSVEAPSVKSTSADSVTVSPPVPPVTVSSPSRPPSVSSPASPATTLSRALPRSVSASAVPVTFSSPVALESVRVSPDTTDCAVVAARSRLTAPLARPVKSSESLSASAASTIVTLADTVPVNTYESFPAPPVRTALPVHPFTVNVFPAVPPFRLTASTPASASLPSPVSADEPSVKSTSAASTTVSNPTPPSKLS